MGLPEEHTVSEHYEGDRGWRLPGDRAGRRHPDEGRDGGRDTSRGEPPFRDRGERGERRRRPADEETERWARPSETPSAAPSRPRRDRAETRPRSDHGARSSGSLWEPPEDQPRRAQPRSQEPRRDRPGSRPRSEGSARSSSALWEPEEQPRHDESRHEKPAASGRRGSSRAARRTTRSRGRRIGRRILIALLALLLIVAVAGVLVVRHLEGNVHTVKLSGNSRAIGSSDGKPLNILLIGSDTRSSKEDCKIGGACAGSTPTAAKGSEATGNADVEMLLHVSADRKHAEVVSIPRDTITDIPDCTGPDGNVVKARRDRINSALTAGPDCSVRTVEALTGITIPHVAVVDFAGVITLTNALGGVPVCVSDDVYDPYSHLKLSKGEHDVQGASALAYLRTRHGFGDGSDIGRSSAQHLFMNSLIRSIRSAGTLSDPVKLYNVADAATKALTVDKGMAGVGSMKDLYDQLNKVPSNDIVFSTMPNVPDPSNPNVVLPAPRASALFERLRDDTWPTPTATPKPSSSSSSSSSSTSTASAPTSSAGADDDPPDETTAKQCAQVATTRTVAIDGIPMTPSQAYAQSPSVPDSAP